MRTPKMRLIHQALAGAMLLAAAAGVSAQSLVLNPANQNVVAGQTAVTADIAFTADTTPPVMQQVSAITFRVTSTDTGNDIIEPVTLTVFNGTGFVPCDGSTISIAAANANVTCNAPPATTNFLVDPVNASNPIGSTTFGRATYNVEAAADPNAPEPTINLGGVCTAGQTTGANGCVRFDNVDLSQDTTGTVTGQTIDVLAISSPTVAYNPAPAAGITFGAGGLGSSATITVTADGSGGTTTPTVQTTTVNNCSVTGAGLSLGAFTPFTINAGDPAGDTDGTIPVNCLYGAAMQTGSLTCNEVTTAPMATTPRTWAITCPQGGATPPTIAYNPALMPTPTITLVGASGSTPTSPVTITRTSNGQAGASVDITTVTASAGFTAVLAPVGSPTVPGGSGTPASATITIGCTIPAVGMPSLTGTVTWNEVTSTGVGMPTTAPRTVNTVCQTPSPNVNSTPPDNSAIFISGAPSTTQGASILIRNTGLADLTITCVLGPVTGTGTITFTGPASPVVPGAQTTINISDTLPGAQGQNNSATLTCTTNDPDAADMTLVYNITGQAVNIVVPTLNTWGKLLMALVVLGLGLVGFTLHRRRAAF